MSTAPATNGAPARASRFAAATIGDAPDRSCDKTILVGPMGIGKTHFLSTIVDDSGRPIFFLACEKGGLKGASAEHTPGKFLDATGTILLPATHAELIDALQEFRRRNAKRPPPGWAAGDGPEEATLRALLTVYPDVMPVGGIAAKIGMAAAEVETMLGAMAGQRRVERRGQGWRLTPDKSWKRLHYHFGIDSISAIEELVHDAVLKSERAKSMADKEWNELYDKALPYWKAVRDELEAIVDSGVHVWITAHAAESFDSSQTSGDVFKRVGIQFRGSGKALAALEKFWVGWADNVLHMQRDITVTKGDKTKRAMATVRATLLFTRDTGRFAAKSRHRVPDRIPATFVDWRNEVRRGMPAPAPKLRAQITALLPQIPEGARAEIEARLAGAKDPQLMALHAHAAGLASVAQHEAEGDEGPQGDGQGAPPPEAGDGAAASGELAEGGAPAGEAAPAPAGGALPAVDE